MRILRTFIVMMAFAALTAACGGKSAPAAENTGGDDMGTDTGGDGYGGDMYGDEGGEGGDDMGEGMEGDGME